MRSGTFSCDHDTEELSTIYATAKRITVLSMTPSSPRRCATVLLLVVGAGLVLPSTVACSHRTPQEQAAAARAEIVKVIREPARADRVLGMIEEWDRRLAARQQLDAGFLARLDALNADYDAPEGTFTALYDARFASELEFIKQAVVLRDQIVAATTPDEWKRLQDVRAELRNPAATATQGAMP